GGDSGPPHRHDRPRTPGRPDRTAAAGAAALPRGERDTPPARAARRRGGTRQRDRPAHHRPRRVPAARSDPGHADRARLHGEHPRPGLDERDRRRRQAGGAGDARRRQPGAPGQHAPGGPAADRGGTALMSELTLTIIKLGFLAVLWLFVLSTVSVIRTDLFG